MNNTRATIRSLANAQVRLKGPKQRFAFALFHESNPAFAIFGFRQFCATVVRGLTNGPGLFSGTGWCAENQNFSRDRYGFLILACLECEVDDSVDVMSLVRRCEVQRMKNV